MSKNQFSQPISNNDIKKQFITIFDKLQNQSTKSVAFDIYQCMVNQCIFSESQMIFIIQQISDFFSSINRTDKEKEGAMKLLALTFSIDIPNKTLYYKYISPVLSVFQSLIVDSNSNLFQPLSNSFADIVQSILPTDIESSQNDLDIDDKRVYEILQGFCFYNMSLEEKANRLCGSLCLIKLVENCPIVIHEEYMKLIWENVTTYLEKQNYTAKYELLNCLISLILGAESSFKPFANSTLYKVFEFLTDSDWLKRKLALNVIYTVIHYCKEEIMPLKEHLIGFLKLLKYDKVKEVREICLLILEILNKDTNVNKSKESVSGNASAKKLTAAKSVIKKNNDVTPKRNNLRLQNSKEFILVEKKKDTTPTNKVISTEKSVDKVKRSVTPNRIVRRNIQTSNDDIEMVNCTQTSTNVKSTKNIINRKEDKTFVNKKMVIHHDPSKSIFKTCPNKAFFNNAKKQPDIVVLDKKKNEPNVMEIDDTPIIINEEDKINSLADTVKIEEEKKDEIVNPNDIHMKEVSIEDLSFSHQHCNNIDTNSNMKKDFTFKAVDNKDNNTKTNEKISMINTLLAQMSKLSSKQLLLLDTMEQIQNESTSEIKKLNAKIKGLESTLSSLTNQLASIRNSNVKQTETYPTNQTTEPSTEDNKINEAFKIALNSNNDEYILHLITNTSINQLGDVDISFLEKSLVRLIGFLSKGDHMKEILAFYKTIILCLKCPLKEVTVQNIKDILQYIEENNEQHYHLDNSDIVDISIILESFEHL